MAVIWGTHSALAILHMLAGKYYHSTGIISSKKEQWRSTPVQNIEKWKQKMKYQHMAVTAADRS
ncbi:hypothetical protein [Acidithiobacillus concretivorus]|uniref:Uncharacterized protein n=1 Tax=Acidithiobacillus concretivorus TaxID=3063952 RepID=A0ABS5ZTA6_9PROT|nr:hypothetical protein [Acidithiobacillus concretivorus]MBU2739413.1 hypothetical protein [Acidithiobacillus concretivorus]